MFCLSQGCIVGPDGVLGGGLVTLLRIVSNTIGFGLIIAILLSFFFLVFGGIKYITSSGDKEGVKAARGTITYALIGLVLAFSSFAIIGFVSGTFGVYLGVPFPQAIETSELGNAYNYCINGSGLTANSAQGACFDKLKIEIDKGKHVDPKTGAAY